MRRGEKGIIYRGRGRIHLSSANAAQCALVKGLYLQKNFNCSVGLNECSRKKELMFVIGRICVDCRLL